MLSVAWEQNIRLTYLQDTLRYLQVSIYILCFAGHLQMAQFNSWSPREHSKTVSPVLSIDATFNVFKHNFFPDNLLESLVFMSLCCRMLYHYLDQKRRESSGTPLHATYLVSGKCVENGSTVRIEIWSLLYRCQMNVSLINIILLMITLINI